jgi:hypothetical protein
MIHVRLCMHVTYIHALILAFLPHILPSILAAMLGTRMEA